MNASVCSQIRDRRVLLVGVSGSSESSSVVPAGQLSAKSSLESIKRFYSENVTKAFRWLSPYLCQAEQETAL